MEEILCLKLVLQLGFVFNMKMMMLCVQVWVMITQLLVCICNAVLVKICNSLELVVTWLDITFAINGGVDEVKRELVIPGFER